MQFDGTSTITVDYYVFPNFPIDSIFETFQAFDLSAVSGSSKIYYTFMNSNDGRINVVYSSLTFGNLTLVKYYTNDFNQLLLEPTGYTIVTGDSTLGSSFSSYSSSLTTSGFTDSTLVPVIVSLCFGCGDGFQEGAEACDDGNLVNGDGCSDHCTVEAHYTCTGWPSTCTCSGSCGNGIKECTEGCDDGNNINGDGCSSTCTVETGWTCPTPNSPCNPICGDSKCVGSETCDSAPTGCTTCSAHTGYTCPGCTTCSTTCGDGICAGSEVCDDIHCPGCTGHANGWTCPCVVSSAAGANTCTTTCGDGITAGTEQCDLGNGNGIAGSGAGCVSGTCIVDTEYHCSASGNTAPFTASNPDTACVLGACPDGTIDGGETCDDGNAVSGDGCSSTCQLETGWICATPNTPCAPICGDGKCVGDPPSVPMETCDDEGDGICNANCIGSIAGWYCTGCSLTYDTTVCTTKCGDGITISPEEQCDDGNNIDGDGCDSNCKFEWGFTCTVANPSVCSLICQSDYGYSEGA